MQVHFNGLIDKPDSWYLALDIGGTICKACILKIHKRNLSLFFSSTPTCNENFLENIQFSNPMVNIKKIDFENVFITGGGSIKYKSYLEKTIGTFQIVDEMESLVKGTKIVMQQFYDQEITTFSESAILVNIGTGASFVAIENSFDYRRIGGTNIGGGTLKGIFEISGGNNFGDSIDNLIESGRNENVDCLVKDIYGSGYGSIGLDGNVVAGSLAKANSRSDLADICTGTVYMICSNIINFISSQSNNLSYKMWIFSGSFSIIPSVSKILTEMVMSETDGVIPLVLNYGAHLGCIGALSEVFVQFKRN